MKAKGNKILQNVKTHWNNMLSLAKRTLSMYMPLVAKMAKDIPSLMVAWVNFEFRCDVNLLISLFSLIPMLEIIHALIKFAQKRDVFVYDYVATIKICQRQLYIHYSNPTMKYSFNVFKEFHDLVDYIHNTLHLKWKASSLDFKISSVEYLCFHSINFTFWATSLDGHGQKMQGFREIFNGLVDAIKASCSSFFISTHFEFVFI
jgi:hypothetical protein